MRTSASPRRHVTRLSAALAAVALAAASIGVPAAADSIRDKEWWLGQYNVRQAWKVTKGRGVTVAVIDSGVDGTQPDLKKSVIKAADFSGLGKDGTTPIGSPESLFHGTAVASVLAGHGHGHGGKSGIIGVAPRAKLLSASVWLGSNMPDGVTGQRVEVAKAVRWAVDNGASVINLSLGWNDPAWPVGWDKAFEYAAQHDVVVVACVGNRSQGATEAWSPSTIPGVIGVTGLRKNGTVSKAESAPGIAVDLAGPGEDLPVSWYRGGYADAEGSSFATPVVAGAAALIRAAHPHMSAANVINRLYATAKPVKGHHGVTTTGSPDPLVGHGRIDVGAAVTSKVPSVRSNPDGSLSQWITMHRRAEDAPKSPLKAGESDAQTDGTASPAPNGSESAPTTVKGDSVDVPRPGSAQSQAGPVFLILVGAAIVVVLAGGLALAIRGRRLTK
ncbi:S8 family serine peptidase [Spelaeicoccus albus]|uniref:Subtilisin family serine protease n=1 Tax=Spelaeicoccus albus TaxID=1280376 RepID=A0A7Z0D2W0_9MICO|nr:S8 family serine peptidase [Spelaeicoccus albus]NYI67872.1 subtilisin family serine protease [Spelaeicoccus albus]